jgi:hypothetical protein
MVKQKKLVISNKSEVLSASEIGQFNYCPVSWYLKRCGYKPVSPLIELGVNKHKKIGEIIGKTNLNKKTSRIIEIIGYAILTITLFLIIIEVFL